MGRPRAKLAKARAEVTIRVRRLLDFAHEGNVHEASQVSGIPYATLRDLYTGRSTNPSLRTLEALAKAYGMFPGWFTDGTQRGDVPGSGSVVYVRGFAHGPTPHIRRCAIITFAAHPLPKLLNALDEALEKMPASPERPIIGEASEHHMQFAIGEFLLGPLLQAEESTRVLLIPDSEPWGKDGWDDPEIRARYTRRLKALGRYWESIFDDVMHSIRTNPAR